MFTIFIHAGLNALGQTTSPTLVTMSLVHHATTFRFSLADILAIPSNRSLEETGASIAGEYSVMFARGMVPAYFARDIVKDSTCDQQKHIINNLKVITPHINNHKRIN